MHARRTTAKASPDKVDQAKQVFESQLVPAIGKMPGSRGAYWLADRETGEVHFFGFFDTKENLVASRPTADSLRSQTAQQIGAEIVGVDEYEVVADTGHKVHKGASHVRVANFEFDPARVEDGIRTIKEKVIPGAQKFAGFQGGFWLLDRANGKGVGVTLFDSKANVVASREQANQIRAESARRTGGKIAEFKEYEVLARAETPAGVAAG